MSNFAFGTYRISDYNSQHIEALREAIKSGVRLIDTSSNYMDGGAERAIALALNSFDENIKDSVEIVSKFGYIQGQNLQEHLQNPFEDVVEYSDECFHSIAPSFMQDQLSKSIERLEVESIGCYLIHNPEYYLHDAINNGVDEDDRLDEMFRRIYNTFIALEEEVKKGRITSYGISSNSFSKPHNSPEFLPYEDLVTIAEEAAYSAGNETHSFTTVELPINILEKEGLKCAKWAKENNLRVLANRPLNAQYNGKMYRLAEYDESREYYHHLNELLEVCDNETLRSLYNLLEQLDENKHKFSWIGDYEIFLFTEIIPHMKKSLEVIDESNRETLLHYIEMFLNEYKKMVAYECSQKTKQELKKVFQECDFTMQECALKFLMEIDEIDYILVGMRKSSYVHEVLSLKA